MEITPKHCHQPRSTDHPDFCPACEKMEATHVLGNLTKDSCRSTCRPSRQHLHSFSGTNRGSKGSKLISTIPEIIVLALRRSEDHVDIQVLAVKLANIPGSLSTRLAFCGEGDRVKTCNRLLTTVIIW